MAVVSSTSSSPAALSFKWMDILEKEFDKSFVSLEELFRGIADDYEIHDVYEANRKLLTSLGSCFIQVVHKAQTIFQNNAKYEAELIHLREEVSETRATLFKLEAEKKYLVCQLQSALLENHKLRVHPKQRQEVSDDKVCQDIQHKLANEMAAIQRVDWGSKKLEDKYKLIESENAALRRVQVELESELVGARLDSKYLDKELAGRIQQIQILLASGTSQDHKQKVWGQIESEMHLQRSKTISNMCYSKQRVKDASARKSAAAAAAAANNSQLPQSVQQQIMRASSNVSSEDCGESRKSSFNNGYGPNSRSNRIKQVHLHKNDVEELGMAILGGHEHGLPIMISEVFPNTAVGRCKKICAGDVILAVNGDSFQSMGHHEAVKYLSALRGTIKFDLENRIDDEIDYVCDMDNRFYDFANEDDAEVAAAQTASASRGHSAIKNHPGRAQPEQESGVGGSGSSTASGSGKRRGSLNSNSTSPAASSLSDDKLKELPEVHNSPRKNGEGRS